MTGTELDHLHIEYSPPTQLRRNTGTETERMRLLLEVVQFPSSHTVDREELSSVRY
jgi:hypothetical protein